MAEFLESQKAVMQNEGGFAAIDGDTYRGIARRFFPDWAGWAIVDSHKPLKQGEIIEDYNLDSLVSTFYYSNFWIKIHGDSIESQAIASYLYDFYVNSGNNAIKAVQAIVGVAQDGVFGNGTLNALNGAGDILWELHKSRIDFYTRIAVGNNAKYLTGWLARATTMYDKLSA